MQQAQQNKVVVETNAQKEVERTTPEQAPVQLNPELLRLVGGGNTSAPVRTW